MIAVAFGPPDMAAALDGLARIRQQADCVEFRLDLFEAPFDLPALLRERGDLPGVVTLRPLREGGKSRLPDDQRLRVLLEAADLGAEYVDLEFDAATPGALRALRDAGARVVLSRHDFSGMPPEMAESWWSDVAALDADVVKVVGAAREVRDCLPVLRTFARADRPTIAIAMGDAGLPTRVLALREEQCFLTYAALDDGIGTAPGQLTCAAMRESYRVERLGPRTRVYGLLGPHVESERLGEYNAWFTGDCWDGVAVPFIAHSDSAGIVTAFRELPVSGWHIHGLDLQTEVRSALDELAPSADRAGKVNGVACRGDGTLVGHWVETPREQYDLWLHSAT